MKLGKRGSDADAGSDSGADVTVSDDLEDTTEVIASKGRPTPKRRDSEGRRGPVSAPRTRKEAMARQRQLAREQRTAKTTARPKSMAEQRAAIKRGDPSALPRRDQGPTRKLARDWVDSRRMASNYLLLIFVIMIVASFTVAALQIVALAVLLGMIVEWFLAGRKIHALAMERYGTAEGKPMGIGFYAGSRAYLPRKWRIPAPQVSLGDPI